jgi:hypothetical protein
MHIDYCGEVISCAAILIAAVLFTQLSREIRRVVFVVAFGTGLLAGAASFADATAAEAVYRLFG